MIDVKAVKEEALRIINQEDHHAAVQEEMARIRRQAGQPKQHKWSFTIPGICRITIIYVR